MATKVNQIPLRCYVTYDLQFWLVNQVAFRAVSEKLPSRSLPPQLAEPSLVQLPARRAILDDPVALAHRAVPAHALGRPVAHHLEQHHVDGGAEDAQAQDADHDQVALAEAVRAGRRVVGPAGVERVRGQDAAEVAEAADEGAGRGHADLAVPRLEDLVGPGHGDGHGGAQAEADQQQAAVARPRPRPAGEGGDEQARDLDQRGADEEDDTVPVEAVRDGRHDEDADEIHLGVVSLLGKEVMG